MGERKQPYKYLSKVYIYSGIFSALLYFSGKTITRLNQRCHYKHLCKVHISNGDFNLGRNEALHRAAEQTCFSLNPEQAQLWKMVWENKQLLLFIQTVVSFSSSHALNCSFLIKGISTNQTPSEHVRKHCCMRCVYQSMITRSYKVMWQVSLTDMRDCDQFSRWVFLCSSNSQSFACFHIILKYRSI